MPQITDIRQQQRKSDRASLYVDGEFWCGVSLNGLEKMGLRVGLEMSAEELEDVQREIARHEALYYCLERLSERSLSRSQLASKLRAREYSEAVISSCLDRCEELMMLDDRQFATSFAESRLERGQGEGKIRQALTMRAGVDRELVDEVLALVFEDDDGAARAAGMLERWYGEEPLDKRTQGRALARLVRQGYSGADARAAVDGRAMTQEDQTAQEDPQEARALVTRRYGDLRDPASRRKAQAFLMRRGWTTDTIRVALD